MKKIKDKVFIPMLAFFIIFALVIATISTIQLKENRELMKEEFLKTVEDCKNIEEDAEEDKREWCQRVIEDDLSGYDTNAYDAYEVYVMDYLSIYLNSFLVIAIIVIGGSYYITKYLKNRVILNNITREDYKTIIRKLFFSAWKYALLVPAMLFTIFLVIFFGVEKFQFAKGIASAGSFVGTIFENNLVLYFIIILINSFVLSMIYINLCLIVARKEHNYILSIIKSYLIIIGIEIIFESIVEKIFINLNCNMGHLFNILNVYNYPNYEYNLSHLFILIVLLIISFIPLLLMYKNKEKLIIDSEKNDNKESD